MGINCRTRLISSFLHMSAGLLTFAIQPLATAEDTWKPADNPLFTRWGKELKVDNVWQEYPRPQMVRADWQNLNGPWDFSLTRKNDEKPDTFEKKILVPFCPDSALSGLRIKVNSKSRMWYHREFTIPEAWKGKRVLLNFGAVTWDSTVLINGKEVCKHLGSYMPFSCDITEALKSDGKQDIVVSAWNPCGEKGEPRGKQAHQAYTTPGGIMYTQSSGIWQTVWLEAVPQTYIEGLRITPDADNSTVRITVNAAGKDAGNAEVSVIAKDGGAAVAEVKGKAGTEIALKISNPKLWTPDEPSLYNISVTLEAAPDAKDSVESYCAMRKISIGKDESGITRMLLNGKFVMQVGPLDQGYWPDGLYTPPSDEAMKFDIDMMKKYGFNMVRKHVKVEPDRWYYYCDKLGLLVWQDMPSSGNKSDESKKQFEAELAEMISGLYNHPCIIMWVPFNEGWGQYDTVRITEMTKKLDPSRLVNDASGWTDHKVGDILDHHTYPVPGAPKPELSRAAVIGEFGGLGYNVPGNRWHETGWGYATYKSLDELNAAYIDLYNVLFKRVKDPGISGAVYTQLTDVEAENNGLMSYDREIFKINPANASIHKGVIPRGFLQPQLSKLPEMFLDEMAIRLSDPPKDAKIYYTLDGTEPSAKSAEYKSPIPVKATTSIKIIAIWDENTISPVQSKTFTKVEGTEIIKPFKLPDGSKKGIQATYFELEEGPVNLPDFTGLKPAKTLNLKNFTINFDRRKNNYAVIYKGFITVPEKGVYFFSCESDDGSMLSVGEKLIVVNDGIHGVKEVTGHAALEAGSYPIEVRYFQGTGGEGLAIRYWGPGIDRREIPESALSASP